MLDGTHYPMRSTMKYSIDDYVKKGWTPGGFLYAVLSNDLMTAALRADIIAGYVYWETPIMCHGSVKKVDAWIERGGQEGLEEAAIAAKEAP